MIDQDKARSNLNEQLARILNRRKGLNTSTTQQSEDKGAEESQSNESKPVDASLGTQQSQIIENPFSMSIGGLRKSVAERGPII